MTIIVMGHIRAAPGEIDRLRDVLTEMVARTNEEEGCDHYSFARAVGDPDLLIISERWASAEALAAHGASAHMAAFNKAIGGAQIQDVSVNAWTAEHWRTLMGR